ncbi:MAG: glutamate formimidoyltransferase [Candidatus Symbiothrix sp.]|jgi:glutamate formiminotransferase|nr:glutamate formimidoyltransferase [Candidatus Symbiothrix sp.]
MKKIVECVPNFSEGRDLAKVERIVGAFRGKAGVKLLDYSADRDHHRMVVTAIGEPHALQTAVVEAVGIAVKEIDLTQHHGEHPRMGAVDVIPFIPLKNMTLDEADTLAQSTGKLLAENYDLPVYLYEQSASAEHRRNLAEVRTGEFEGLPAKMQLPEWQPDFGPAHRHPTAGAAIVGARRSLIAFNVNLNTADLTIAKAIAKKIRFSSGGLPCVKAKGFFLKETNQAQVSMNLTDYTQTGIYQVVEAIRTEAAHYDVSVANCELIGLIPLQAVTDSFAQYLGLTNFTVKQILNLSEL